MTKSLFILTLLLHSCGSGNSNAETKQDTVSHAKSEQPQIIVTSKKEIVDSSFLSFWEEFTDAVRNKNQQALKDMSFDSLYCEHKNVFADEFIKYSFYKIFDDTVVNRLSDKSKVEFIDEEIDVNYLPQFVMKQMDKEKLLMKKVNITRVDKYPDGPTTIVLEFIKTKKGYKFYGYDKFG
jgi:hypothetical protein